LEQYERIGEYFSVQFSLAGENGLLSGDYLLASRDLFLIGAAAAIQSRPGFRDLAQSKVKLVGGCGAQGGDRVGIGACGRAACLCSNPCVQSNSQGKDKPGFIRLLTGPLEQYKRVSKHPSF
jgi:hypothetical protein